MGTGTPRTWRRWKRGSALVLGALLVAAGSAVGDPAPAGRWRFSMDRPGMLPPVARGILLLEKEGKAWRGTLTFEMLMNSQPQKLDGIEVKGSAVAFRLEALGYRLKGKLAKGKLAGTCITTEGQVYRWTAVPDVVEPIDLFEKGLTFQGYFPRGDAKEQGLAEPALFALVHAAAESDTDALVVLHQGKVVCERTFGPDPGPVPIMSVTKFVTALAVGFLLEEGKIASLEAPLSTWFSEWGEGERKEATLRHVLTHTSGIAHADVATELNRQQDRVAYVRRAEVRDVGAAWSYNNDAVALLSGILAQAAGEPVDAYLQSRLFAPLSIEKPRWNRDGAGNTVTYAELWLPARDLARVGQLVVDRGAVGEKQLLQAKTLELLASEATPLQKTQGLLWFRVLDDEGRAVGVRHDGWLGQHLIVFPEAKLVGVRLRHGERGEGSAYGLGHFAALLRATLPR